MLLSRWRQRQRVKAVHEDDLEALLRSLGLLESVLSGQAVCSFCGSVMTLDNLRLVFPQRGRVSLCCDALACVQRALQSNRENPCVSQ